MAERKPIDKAARNQRLAMGVGVGGGSAVVLAIVISGIYQEATGKVMDQQLAMATGALIGALGSTIAICLREVKSLIIDIMKYRAADGKGDD